MTLGILGREGSPVNVAAKTNLKIIGGIPFLLSGCRLAILLSSFLWQDKDKDILHSVFGNSQGPRKRAALRHL